MFPAQKQTAQQVVASYQAKLAALAANRATQQPVAQPSPIVRPTGGMPWLNENLGSATLGSGILGVGAGLLASLALPVAAPVAAGIAGAAGVFGPQLLDYFVNPRAAPPSILPPQVQTNPTLAPQYGLGIGRPGSFGPQGIFGEEPKISGWQEANPLMKALGFASSQPQLEDQYTGWNPVSQLAEWSRRTAWQQQFAQERSIYENPLYETVAPNRVINKFVKNYAGDLALGVGTLPERLGGVFSRTAAMETKNPLSKAYGFLMGQNPEWMPSATEGHGLLLETLRTLDPEAQSIMGFYGGLRGLSNTTPQPEQKEKVLDYLLSDKGFDSGKRANMLADFHRTGNWPTEIEKPSTIDNIGAYFTYNLNRGNETFTNLPLGEQMLAFVAIPELMGSVAPALGIGKALQLSGKWAESTLRPSLSLLQDWNTVKAGARQVGLRFSQAELGATFKATGLLRPSEIMDVVNKAEIFSEKTRTHSIRNWLVKKGMGVFDMTLASKAQAMTEAGMEQFYELLKRTDNDNVGQFVQSIIDLGDWSPLDSPESMSDVQKASLKILEDLRMGDQVLGKELEAFYGFESGQTTNLLTSTHGVMARKLLLNMSEGIPAYDKLNELIPKSAEQVQNSITKLVDLITKARLPRDAALRTPLLMTAAYDAQASLVRQSVNSALGSLGVKDVPMFMRSSTNTWLEWQRWYAKMWHIGPVPGVGVRNVLGDLTKLLLQDKQSFWGDAQFMKSWNEGLPNYLSLRGVESSTKKTMAVREGFLDLNSKTPLWKKLGFESGSYFMQFTEDWLHNKVQAGSILSFMDRFHRTKAMSLDYGDMSSVPADVLLMINNKLNKAIHPSEIQNAFGDIFKGIHWTQDEQLMNVINQLRADDSVNREVGEKIVQMLDQYKGDTTPDRFFNDLDELYTDQILARFMEVDPSIKYLNDWTPSVEFPEPYKIDGHTINMENSQRALLHVFEKPDSDEAKVILEELKSKYGLEPADILQKGKEIQENAVAVATEGKIGDSARAVNMVQIRHDYFPPEWSINKAGDIGNNDNLSRVSSAYQTFMGSISNLVNLVDRNFAYLTSVDFPKAKKFYDLEVMPFRYGDKVTTVAEHLRRSLTTMKDGKLRVHASGSWLKKYAQGEKIVLDKLSGDSLQDLLNSIHTMGSAVGQEIGLVASAKRAVKAKQSALSNVARVAIDTGHMKTIRGYWIGTAELSNLLRGGSGILSPIEMGHVPLRAKVSKVVATAAEILAQENLYREAIENGIIAATSGLDEDWSVFISPPSLRILISKQYRQSNKPAMTTVTEIKNILQQLGVAKNQDIMDILNLMPQSLKKRVDAPKSYMLYDLKYVLEKAKEDLLLGKKDVDGVFMQGKSGKEWARLRTGSAKEVAVKVPSFYAQVPRGSFTPRDYPSTWANQAMYGKVIIVLSDGSIAKIQYWNSETEFVYSISDKWVAPQEVGGEMLRPDLYILKDAQYGNSGNYREAYLADLDNYLQILGKPTGENAEYVKAAVEKLRSQLSEHPSVVLTEDVRPSMISQLGQVRGSIFQRDPDTDAPLKSWFFAEEIDYLEWLNDLRTFYTDLAKKKKTKIDMETMGGEITELQKDWQRELMKRYQRGEALSDFKMKIVTGEGTDAVVLNDGLQFIWDQNVEDLDNLRNKAVKGATKLDSPKATFDYEVFARDRDAAAIKKKTTEAVSTERTLYDQDPWAQASTKEVTSNITGQPDLGWVSPYRNEDLDTLISDIKVRLEEKNWKTLEQIERQASNIKTKKERADFIKNNYNFFADPNTGVTAPQSTTIIDYIWKNDEEWQAVKYKVSKYLRQVAADEKSGALDDIERSIPSNDYIMRDDNKDLRRYMLRKEGRENIILEKLNDGRLDDEIINVEDLPQFNPEFMRDPVIIEAQKTADDPYRDTVLDDPYTDPESLDDWDTVDQVFSTPAQDVDVSASDSSKDWDARRVLRPAELQRIKAMATVELMQDLKKRLSEVWGDNSLVSTSEMTPAAIAQLQKLQAHKLDRLSFARSVANRVAAITTDHLLYNYNRTYNFDSYLNHAFGYPFWYMRTYSDYPRQLLTDPNYLAKLYQWNKQINQINEDKDLPVWMRSSVKLQVPDIYNLRDMVGTDTVYLPMLSQLSPLEQLMNGNFTNAEREKNVFGQVYNKMYGWGPGPHALIPLALGTALLAHNATTGNEESANQAAQYFGYLGSQTRIIPALTAQMEKSGMQMPISGGISVDAPAMLLSAGGAFGSPGGSMPLRALMALGAVAQFAVTHKQTKDGIKFVGPVYDQRRVATVLSEWGNTPDKMVAGFAITPELLQDAALVSKDPWMYGNREELSAAYSIWSAAVTESRARKMLPDILTFMGGPGVSARGDNEMIQEKMYKEVQDLYDKRETKLLDADQYSEEWTKLSIKYPNFPIYGMFKRYGDQAFNVYAYSVISRVGKGSTAKAVYNTVGLDYNIIGKFFDNKGIFTYGTEEAQLKEGIIRLGMLLKAPDAPTKLEWSKAGVLFRRLQGEMETMFPGTSAKLDVYYNLEKQEQAQFLRDHLDLSSRMETELAMTMQDPKYRNTLGPYYVSLKDTRDFIKLTYMNKDHVRSKAYEVYLENSRDWPEQKEKQFLADFDLFEFHRGYQKMSSNLDNTISVLIDGIDLPLLPKIREDAPEIEAKKSMQNSLMQISQREQKRVSDSAMAAGRVGNASTVAPEGAGVGGGAMPGMMSGNGTGTIRQENPSANLLDQWEYLYSQKQVSSVGYVQEYKDQFKYKTLQPLLEELKGNFSHFQKALDTPLLTSKWPTFNDPMKWEENLVQYVKLLGGEGLRSAMMIEASKGFPSDPSTMVWSKVIGTVRTLSLSEIGRMSAQHPELRDLGIVREQSSTYSGPTLNALLDTVGASVSIQEDGTISVSGETVKKDTAKKAKSGTQISSQDIEDYVSKWAKKYYGENIEQLYDNYIMTQVSQGVEAGRRYWKKYPQLAKYQAFSVKIWERYKDVKNGLKESFDDIGKLVSILQKITPATVRRGDKDSDGYTALFNMMQSKSSMPKFPVSSLFSQSNSIDGRLFANVIAVIKTKNPALAQTFAEFMQANPQKRQAMLQASPDLARYITQFTPEQLANIETSYNKGLDIGGNSYGQASGVRVYQQRSGRTGL